MAEWEGLYKAIGADWRRFLEEKMNAVPDEEKTAQKPVINVWTVQMGKWRQAKSFDITLLDITAKSGLPIFAPKFSDVMRYKRGELSPPEYSEIYLNRMKVGIQLHPDRWERLKKHSKIAFACYCKAGQFCHRHLFTELASAYLEHSGFGVSRQGELTK